MQRSAEELPQSVQAWDKKNPSELPPDARQAKVFAEAKKASKDPDSKRRTLIGSTALTVQFELSDGRMAQADLTMQSSWKTD